MGDTMFREKCSESNKFATIVREECDNSVFKPVLNQCLKLDEDLFHIRFPFQRI